MPFVYEPITPADHERMESLNIMIRWKKPNARHWTVNRETGEFLVWVYPEWDPPYWNWFAFWWRERLFCVGLNSSKTHPDTGYCLEIAGVGAADRKPILPEDEKALGTALFDAVKVEATTAAAELFAGRRERKGIPPDPHDMEPVELSYEINDLRTSPFVTFHVDFPRSIK